MNERRSVLGFMAAGAVLVLVAAGAAVAATIPCGGGERCGGTQEPDRITGDASDDYIAALGGADGADGGAGDDVVEGNRGDDQPGTSGDPANVLEGGTGDDVVMGGTGDDVVIGDEGDDRIEDASRGDKDRLFGGPGADFVDALDGDALDTVDCGDGKDSFAAEPWDTVLDNCEQERS